jgi:organic radical activating enzyme
MFGNNPARPPEPGDGRQLWIQEVFYTLQGEGPFMGEPSVFVRTAGCNLRCFWCDTEFESSTWRPTLEELLARIDALRPAHCDLIVLTGGEPFRQNIVPLVEVLLERGLRVQIETNGTLWLELPRSPRLTIVCSPKTKELHPDIVPRVDVFKYVLAAGEVDPEDGLPNASTQHAGMPGPLFRPPLGAAVSVMPRDDGDARNAANRAAATEAALRHGHRLTIQLHKVIGVE